MPVGPETRVKASRAASRGRSPGEELRSRRRLRRPGAPSRYHVRIAIVFSGKLLRFSRIWNSGMITRLGPFDVVMALRLLSSAGTLVQLAEELAVAPSQVHLSLSRLQGAGLLRPQGRAANARALGEFLIHGVRYAFPARRGEIALGVPTAYSAPPLSAAIDATDVLVWPAPGHPRAVRGFAITPLYRGAPKLPERARATYELVAMVDALRLGEPRTRLAVRSHLERALEIRTGDTA